MKTITQVTMLALVVGLALPAQAQFGGHGKGRGGPPSADKMAKMKEFRAKALREFVGLDEAKAAKVEATMDGFQERRIELHQTMRDNMLSLRALLKEDSNDQEAFANALDTLRVGHEEMQKLHAEQMEAVRGLLTPKEQAKLLVTMRKFKGKASTFRGGKKGRHGMGPPDDMGPPDFDDDME